MNGLFAQSSVVSAGNSTSSSNGSFSYTLGYLSTQSSNQEDAKIAEGLQHAYEIYEVTNVSDLNTDFDISVYPNPSVEELFLEVGNLNETNITHQLFDINGKSISKEMPVSEKSIINMKLLSSGSYLLVVTQNQNIVKSFKVIKK
tara:strand:+ start:223 stop:657 length:435 start_codon:yes stop_codon:yes gene_type:complete